jgi:hypothetical protein
MLASNSSCSALAMSGSIYTALILEAGLFFDEVPLCGVVVAVIKLAVLDSAELSSVLLRKHVAVLNGLDSTVVVILVNLLVDSSLNFLVEMRLNNFVLNSRGNSLVNSGVVVSRLGHEVSDSCLGLVHCDIW